MACGLPPVTITPGLLHDGFWFAVKTEKQQRGGISLERSVAAQAMVSAFDATQRVASAADSLKRRSPLFGGVAKAGFGNLCGLVLVHLELDKVL